MMVFLRVVRIKMATATCFGTDPVGPLAARCALVTARPECVREGVSANSTGTRPTSSRRNRHGQQLETGDGRSKRHGALRFRRPSGGLLRRRGAKDVPRHPVEL